MKKTLLCVIILTILLFVFIFCLCTRKKDPIDNYNKPLKILILIITSDSPRWNREKKLWEKYMNLDKDITCKFIRCVPNAHKNVPNELILDCKESFIPGIFQKSIKALQYYQNQYDYYIRTNLSTFIVFDRLKQFLKETHPVYTGHIVNSSRFAPNSKFASGTNIILNNNANNMLINYKKTPEYMNKTGLKTGPDDVLIGFLLEEQDIPVKKYNLAQRHDWDSSQSFKSNINNTKIFFRLKEIPNFDQVGEKLLKTFYS